MNSYTTIQPTQYDIQALHKLALEACGVDGDAYDHLYAGWLKHDALCNALESFETYGSNERVAHHRGFQQIRMGLKGDIAVAELDLRCLCQEIMRQARGYEYLTVDLMDGYNVLITTFDHEGRQIDTDYLVRTSRLVKLVEGMLGMYGMVEWTPGYWVTPKVAGVLGKAAQQEAAEAALVESAERAAAKLREAAQSALDVLLLDEEAGIKIGDWYILRSGTPDMSDLNGQLVQVIGAEPQQGCPGLFLYSCRGADGTEECAMSNELVALNEQAAQYTDGIRWEAFVFVDFPADKLEDWNEWLKSLCGNRQW